MYIVHLSLPLDKNHWLWLVADKYSRLVKLWAFLFHPEQKLVLP